ncbi:MAG: dienelactone hydrolase family protein [Planctomycetota bacterium]
MKTRSVEMKMWSIGTPLLLTLLVFGCAPASIEVGPPQELVEDPHSSVTSIDAPNIGTVHYATRVKHLRQGAAPLVVLLHYGYDGEKPDPGISGNMISAFAFGLTDNEPVVLAPVVVEGDWLNPKNEAAVVWLTRCAMETYEIDPEQVYLCGYSMGGEGTYHIASRHQDLFSGAIAMAAPTAGPVGGWEIPLYVLHSPSDSIVSSDEAKAHTAKIKAQGGNVKYTTVPGASHYSMQKFAPFLSDAFKWLQENQ